MGEQGDERGWRAEIVKDIIADGLWVSATIPIVAGKEISKGGYNEMVLFCCREIKWISNS